VRSARVRADLLAAWTLPPPVVACPLCTDNGIDCVSVEAPALAVFAAQSGDQVCALASWHVSPCVCATPVNDPPVVAVHRCRDRDRYGFVRDEEYAQKEKDFGRSSARTSEAVSLEWIAFLKRLSVTKDAMNGTRALRRNEFGAFSYCRKGGAEGLLDSRVNASRSPSRGSTGSASPAPSAHLAPPSVPAAAAAESLAGASDSDAEVTDWIHAMMRCWTEQGLASASTVPPACTPRGGPGGSLSSPILLPTKSLSSSSSFRSPVPSAVLPPPLPPSLASVSSPAATSRPPTRSMSALLFRTPRKTPTPADSRANDVGIALMSPVDFPSRRHRERDAIDDDEGDGDGEGTDVDIVAIDAAVSPVSLTSPASTPSSTNASRAGSPAVTASGKPVKTKGSSSSMLAQLRELVLQGIPTAYRAAVGTLNRLVS
jgi:hypothetical protein